MLENLDYLSGKPIAILGGGSIGKACAADCALAGQKVNLCDLEPFAEKSLFGADRGINIWGRQRNLFSFERSGTGKMNMVTTSIAQAVKGAGLILICTPALGHVPFFQQLIPCLEDGQIIHIIPDNYGTLILRRMMREAGCDKKVVIGGWSSAPYGCRVETLGGHTFPRVHIEYRAITLRGAALPMLDTETFLASTKYLGCFDAITTGHGVAAAETVLDTCFTNVNPMLHVPGTILGVGVMENWGVIYGNKYDKYDFSIYSHAFCPSISRIQLAFYEEEIALAEAVGVGIQRYEERQFFNRKSVLAEEFMGKDYEIPFDQQEYESNGSGPFTIHNRYLTEDVPVGCRVYHELGVKYGVKTPVIDSMITMASVLLEKDYFHEGYTLEHLGIAHLDKQALLDYLHKGVI